MCFAMELQTPRVYITFDLQCALKPSQPCIRHREIGLDGENVIF